MLWARCFQLFQDYLKHRLIQKFCKMIKYWLGKEILNNSIWTNYDYSSHKCNKKICRPYSETHSSTWIQKSLQPRENGNFPKRSNSGTNQNLWQRKAAKMEHCCFFTFNPLYIYISSQNRFDGDDLGIIVVRSQTSNQYNH